MGKKTKGTRWRTRLSIAALASLLTLLAGEVGLKILGRFSPEPDAYVGDHEDAASLNFVPDPEVGWRMKPEVSFSWSTEQRSIVYRSDSEGYRISAEAPRPSGVDGRTIVFVGDSFTWGTGVTFEETFAAQVCEAFEGAMPRVLAMPGYGVDQAWRSLVVAGLDPKPDLVVFGLYPDDFGRSLQAYRWKERFNKPAFRRSESGLVRRTASDRPGALFRALDERSNLFTLGKQTWRLLGRSLPVGEWWHLNAAILDATRAVCEEHEVPVLFVHIPEKRWRAFPSLSGYFEENGAAFLDLHAASEQPPKGAYFETDQHLSPTGHRWVAEQIVRWIEESRVLD